MKIFLFATAIVALSLQVTPADRAEASAPVVRTMNACVVDGLVISVDGYWLNLSATKPPIVLSKYEGKNLELSGSLYPGDRFIPQAKTLKVIGKCKRLKNKRFRQGWSWAHRSIALGQYAGNQFKEALTAINKAIAVDKKVYAFYLTRARILHKLGNDSAARKDAKHALKLSKNPTQRKWSQEAIDEVR